jgi:hypothetical protein
MIELSPTLTLEINHFTPLGITADFVSDDELFSKIVETLSYAGGAPIATSTPIPATTSGY